VEVFPGRLGRTTQKSGSIGPDLGELAGIDGVKESLHHLDDERRPAMALQELSELLAGNGSSHRWALCGLTDEAGNIGSADCLGAVELIYLAGVPSSRSNHIDPGEVCGAATRR
jgi:hypothetical protein